MLPDQGKGLQARKRLAKRTAVAPTKERDYVSGAAAAFDAQEEDLLMEDHRGEQKGVTRR